MRINVIPMHMLADQHLFAEFREIKMLPKSLLRSWNSKKGIDYSKISKHYTLNTGHGYFFYDKLNYIFKRFNQLAIGCVDRGYNISDESLEIINPFLDDFFYTDYTPTIEAQLLNLDRIILNIGKKSIWYKYKGMPMNWNSFYMDYIKSICDITDTNLITKKIPVIYDLVQKELVPKNESTNLSEIEVYFDFNDIKKFYT